jgi:hypothetical protein
MNRVVNQSHIFDIATFFLEKFTNFILVGSVWQIFDEYGFACNLTFVDLLFDGLSSFAIFNFQISTSQVFPIEGKDLFSLISVIYSDMAISDVFSMTTMTSAEIMLNAATAMTNNNINAIIFFSILTASNNGPCFSRHEV